MPRWGRLLSHRSAGGQLLHPSEVYSSNTLTRCGELSTWQPPAAIGPAAPSSTALKATLPKLGTLMPYLRSSSPAHAAHLLPFAPLSHGNGRECCCEPVHPLYAECLLPDSTPHGGLLWHSTLSSILPI